MGIRRLQLDESAGWRKGVYHRKNFCLRSDENVSSELSPPSIKTFSISVHRRFLAGPISPFVAVLLLTAKSALAQSVWTGATSADWNDPANWTAGVPTGVNATINLNTPNVATITANVPTPVDILIGNGGGTTGQVNQTAGAVSTGGGNWMFVGRAGGSGTYKQSGGTAGATRLLVGSDGGTGFYNVANTGSTGGPLTGFGLGAGGLTIGNRLYVGGNSEGSALGGTGTMNINTTGTIAIGNDLALGTGGGTGTLNMDAGTVTTGGWNFIGKDENGSNGKGTLNIGGGLLNNGGGRTYVGFGNAAGRMVMSGGEYRNTGEFFVVGHNNLANATASSLAMTGGTVNANLFTVGGDGDNAGKGFVAVNGATAQINAGGELWVGQGNGSRGLMDVNAGTV